MNTDEIKKLLEKYYEAETTKEEEALLHEALMQDDLGDLPLSEREIFRLIESEKSVSLTDSFNLKLVEEATQEPTNTGKPFRFAMLYRITAVAASILLLIGIVIQFESKKQSGLPNTFSDPVIAYQETKKALYTVSHKFNYGMEKLNKLQIINKAFDGLEELEKLEKYSDKLSNL